MESNIAKDLDHILEFLNSKDSYVKWFELLDQLKINRSNKELLFKELSLNNYINIMNIASGNHLVQISSNGKAFLQSSSFSKQHNKSKGEKRRTVTQSILLIITSIFSIVGVLSSLFLGILTYNQNGTIKDLTIENKILKQENEKLKSLPSSKHFSETNNK